MQTQTHWTNHTNERRPHEPRCAATNEAMCGGRRLAAGPHGARRHSVRAHGSTNFRGRSRRISGGPDFWDRWYRATPPFSAHQMKAPSRFHPSKPPPSERPPTPSNGAANTSRWSLSHREPRFSLVRLPHRVTAIGTPLPTRAEHRGTDSGTSLTKGRKHGRLAGRIECGTPPIAEKAHLRGRRGKASATSVGSWRLILSKVRWLRCRPGICFTPSFPPPLRISEALPSTTRGESGAVPCRRPEVSVLCTQ